jgi:hypothetical protein
MKFNQWTLALAGVGIISLGSVAQAEEQHSVMTALSSTTLSGYVDTSASWWTGKQSAVGGDFGALPGRTFDNSNKQDGFFLNAVKLVLEKPLGDATTWSAGYKADLVFGPDANYYGTKTTFGGTGADGGDFNVKQAYVALRAPVGNGLDVKLGVWDTLIGYEFFESGSNPNYSRSYGYALEPTHHTGVLASYKLTEMFSVSGAIANANIGGINDRPTTDSKKTYLAAVTVTLPEGAGSFKNSVISAGYVGGQNGASSGFGNVHDTRNYYVGATLNTPLEGFTFGAAWDYRENGAPTAGTPALPTVNDAWAAALYATYAMDKWSFNVRADYTQATNGTFYDTGIPEERNELGSITGTVGYNLWENVLTRVEVRYDRDMGGDHPFGTGQESALTIALNAIYKF